MARTVLRIIEWVLRTGTDTSRTFAALLFDGTAAGASGVTTTATWDRRSVFLVSSHSMIYAVFFWNRRIVIDRLGLLEHLFWDRWTSSYRSWLPRHLASGVAVYHRRLRLRRDIASAVAEHHHHHDHLELGEHHFCSRCTTTI